MRPGIFTCNMPYAWEGRIAPSLGRKNSTDSALSMNGVAPEWEFFDSLYSVVSSCCSKPCMR